LHAFKPMDGGHVACLLKLKTTFDGLDLSSVVRAPNMPFVVVLARCFLGP
jgi:hypothetical protein